MENMGLNEIREAFLSFFESKGHLRLPSFSLVPENDKSLLLINAGMAPLKPYFTGMQIPPRKRVTTCQKCIRTGDIENVGKTSRHGTFFEMLGNFSFGDYFKKEVIPWSWEFITEVLKLPKEKLYVTIYLDDDEAYDIWTKSTDIKPERIFRLGKDDNFWEIGEGPCGPCSEIHYNKTDEKITTLDEFIKAGNEDKTVELWNLVFTQFDKDKNGNYNRLSHPNIDTGMGLERIATVMQNKNNIFEVDTIKSILDKVSEISGKRYGENYNDDVSMRIITDHIRSVTFMISDGILPSNEGRGYVLRRLLRRASRHGRMLGINGNFIKSISDVVIKDSCGAYPELKEKRDYIKKVIDIEEKRFSETLDAGMDILKSYIDDIKSSNGSVLSGSEAFKLYDTYGFPVELTAEILEEKGISINMDGFNKEMKDQKVRARQAREQSNYMGKDSTCADRIPSEIETVFEGYDNLKFVSEVKTLIKDEKFVSEISSGEEGILVTSHTPFYAEMGGQVGDRGKITGKNFEASVIDCKKNISGKILHFIKVISGKVNVNDIVTLEVDSKIRENTCKNHTATHILDEALRKVVGAHVHQSGSYVDDERLRFDFTHFKALSKDEIKKVELIVNDEIMKAQNVITDVMNLDEAKKSGAIALFDDKYSDKVRVVSVGNFNKEFCGGTHVKNSGEIGVFKIVSESGIAAGVRRIEALTGFSAMSYIENKDKLLNDVESLLKCSEKNLLSKVQSQIAELKESEKEIVLLKAKLAGGAEDEILKNIKVIKGIQVAKAIVKNVDANSLRDLADKIRNKMGEGAVVLGSCNNDKVNLIAMASKDAISKGFHCGKVIKEVAKIVGGGGGGRPDMAQAGGKKPEKLKDAMENLENIMENLVK